MHVHGAWCRPLSRSVLKRHARHQAAELSRTSQAPVTVCCTFSLLASSVYFLIFQCIFFLLFSVFINQNPWFHIVSKAVYVAVISSLTVFRGSRMIGLIGVN